MALDFTEAQFIDIVSSDIFETLCDYESDRMFFDIAKIGRTATETNRPVVNLIKNIMSMYHTGKPRDPYRPLFVFEDRRSYAIEDLTPELADILFNNLDKISNIIIRTRIADVLWIRKLPKGKALDCAKVAITGYYEMLSTALHNGCLHTAHDIVDRLDNISLLLKGSAEREKWFLELPKLIAMDFDTENDSSFFYWRDLLKKAANIEWSKDHQNVPQEAFNKTATIVQIALDKHEYHWARAFYSIAINLSRQTKTDAKTVIELRKNAAKTYELEMMRFDNPLQQTRFLNEAIKAYMAIPGCRKDVSRLTKQKEATHRVSEMYHTSFSQEIPKEYIEQSNNVSGKSFPDAIYELSALIYNNVINTSDPKTLQESTRKNTSIIDKIASLVSLNSMGQVIKTYFSEEETRNKRMIDHMLIGNSISMLPVSEAIKLINTEHFYSLNDIIPLVQNSAFVPQKHIITMSRGVEAFLRDDMLLAANFLILPFEDCIRNLLFLRQNITKNKNDGSEEHIVTLEALIDNCQKEQIFDDTFAWFFKTYLVDKELNFRNLIAHGLLGSREYNDNRIRTLCAVIILLIFYTQTINYIKIYRL